MGMKLQNALLCLLLLMLQLLLLSSTKHPSLHLSPFRNQDGITTTRSSPFFCCRVFSSSSPKVNRRTTTRSSPFFCCRSPKLNRRFFTGGMSFLQSFLNYFLLGDHFPILPIHKGMEFPSLLSSIVVVI